VSLFKVGLFPEARMPIYKPASCRVSEGANRSNLFTELIRFTSKISNEGETCKKKLFHCSQLVLLLLHGVRRQSGVIQLTEEHVFTYKFYSVYYIREQK
jgi:hypothetical protein